MLLTRLRFTFPRNCAEAHAQVLPQVSSAERGRSSLVGNSARKVEGPFWFLSLMLKDRQLRPELTACVNSYINGPRGKQTLRFRLLLPFCHRVRRRSRVPLNVRCRSFPQRWARGGIGQIKSGRSISALPVVTGLDSGDRGSRRGERRLARGRILRPALAGTSSYAWLRGSGRPELHSRLFLRISWYKKTLARHRSQLRKTPPDLHLQRPPPPLTVNCLHRTTPAPCIFRHCLSPFSRRSASTAFVSSSPTTMAGRSSMRGRSTAP